MALEMLKQAANVDITFVPYPGAAPAINALLGRHVTSVFTSYVSVGEQMNAGQLRALATTARMRIEQLPDVPTGAESGYKDIGVDLWDGVVAPAKTPIAIVAEIAGWFAAALREPETRRKLVAQGLFPVGMCGAEVGALIRKQYDEYGRVVRKANLKVE
jgi:tripartite-type tricarboxylate transporter receptor subunit TctC